MSTLRATLLAGFFALAIVFGIGLISPAHAQPAEEPAPAPEAPPADEATPDDTPLNFDSMLGGHPATERTYNAHSHAITAGDFGCQANWNVIGILDNCIAYMLFVAMKITIYFAAMVSIALNWVLMEMVVGMGQLMGNIPGIMVAWEFLRDAMNIALVFFTLFVGIATILGSEKYGYKTLLFRVVLVALLINFSSTFAKLVIDISNYVTTETYAMLMTADHRTHEDVQCAEPLSDGELNNGQNFCINNGLAGVFWNKLKVLTIWDTRKMEVAGGPENSWRHILTFMVGSIMFLVMAFVFGSMAIMFAARFVVLGFLIIVSPIALFMYLTNVSAYGKKWFDRLLKQSFFAPAVMIMWWITYLIAEGLGARFAISGTLAEGAVAPSDGNLDAVGIILFYFLVMGMLLASLALARSASAAGSKFVIGGTSGLIARGGRFTLGRGGAALAESRFANRLATSNNIVARTAGRNLKRVGDYAGGASFDPRAMSKTAQKSLGAPQKGGHLCCT